MKVIIRPTAAAASSYIADLIIERVNNFIATAQHPKFVLGLPTGSSPEQIYACLVSAHRAGIVSFANVITFNMDEYVALPEDHPESYHSFMYKHFFAHIDIDPANVNILNGNAPDLAVECNDYETRIKAAGGIDLFLGGIGPDGHIAFNEPGSSLSSRTRVKTLAEDTIRANSRFFNNDLTLVPQQALTVGVATVMDSREVVLIVLGSSKALALQKTIEGGVSQMWTASCLQMHTNATIGCDDDATGEMLVKNVKYFKSIEVISSQSTTTATPLPITPQAQSSNEKMTNWRGALKELRIDTAKKPVIDDEDGELTPDSMSSRLVDSAIGMSPPARKSTIDGMDFGSMGGRVNSITV